MFLSFYFFAAACMHKRQAEPLILVILQRKSDVGLLKQLLTFGTVIELSEVRINALMKETCIVPTVVVVVVVITLNCVLLFRLPEHFACRG